MSISWYVSPNKWPGLCSLVSSDCGQGGCGWSCEQGVGLVAYLSGGTVGSFRVHVVDEATGQDVVWSEWFYHHGGTNTYCFGYETWVGRFLAYLEFQDGTVLGPCTFEWTPCGACEKGGQGSCPHLPCCQGLVRCADGACRKCCGNDGELWSEIKPW